MPLVPVTARIFHNKHLSVVVSGTQQVGVREVTDEPVLIEFVRRHRLVAKLSEDRQRLEQVEDLQHVPLRLGQGLTIALDEQQPLLGWRLTSDGSAYRRIGTSTRVDSQVAGASFEVIDGLLRIVDAQGVLPGGFSAFLDAGRAARLQEPIVRVLETRFGPPLRPAHAQRLRSHLAWLGDDALRRALTRAVTVASADAFLASLEG